MVEIDRMLRPEGEVEIRDPLQVIETESDSHGGEKNSCSYKEFLEAKFFFGITLTHSPDLCILSTLFCLSFVP